MACMCGDIHCGSCGFAQGNSKCPICGAWMDDECEHYDEETGKLKPEFKAEAEANYAAWVAAEEAAAEEYLRNEVLNPWDY